MTPILMDFGSAKIAKMIIEDRKMANRVQDEAAEYCSMPYRAPELFDVKVNSELDEKIDIWSLGCTLFCMAYGQSPFEMTINQQGGGTLSLAILNRQYSIPNKSLYSNLLQDLISKMLIVDPQDRPTVHQILQELVSFK